MSERECVDIDYSVMVVYRNGTTRFLRIDAKNLNDAIREARGYRAPNLVLYDIFGNQYVARVNKSDVLSPRKNRCLTESNRSCGNCFFKSKWGSGCMH